MADAAIWAIGFGLAVCILALLACLIDEDGE